MLLKLYDNFMKAMAIFFNRSNTAIMKFTLQHSRFNADRLIRALKRLTLISGIALLSSGCAMSQLKQREAVLNQQQQQLEEQQQRLQKENSRLAALKAELGQEQMRLKVLKKSLSSAADTTPVNQSGTDSHVIVGELEHVYISPPDIQLTARIDTGAKTSSLNALDLTEFERDGKAHVRFYVMDPDTGEKIEVIRRVIRHVKIKEHEGESKSRPVVRMRVRLGNLDQRIRMTLTDRSEFKNQVLIGRNFLRDFVNVDVSKKYLSKPVIESN